MKKDDLCFAVGVFPTLELLTQKPQYVNKVYLSGKSRDNSGISKIIKICNDRKISFEENDRKILKVSKAENCYAVGEFARFLEPVEPKATSVVLVNPTDAGNLGTIIRTMMAFGVTNLCLVKPTVDIFDIKTVRASMGAVFQISFSYFDTFKSYLDFSKEKKKYLFYKDGNFDLKETSFKEPCDLIFGSEGPGLSDEFRTFGETIKISQSDKVDSLNLAITVGIVLHKIF